MECDYAVMGVLDDYDPRHKKVWWRQVALTQPETQNHATVAQWHYHSDCINFYRHQSRMVSLSHRFRVLEGLPLFLLVTMAQFPKVPLSLTQSSGAFHKAGHPGPGVRAPSESVA